ncbi:MULTISPECIES: MarR family winged helix-turn-helix transcriptional regulator [Bradyrhizobium]|uniref:MarR family winged helix-turn-helix transcriptional regulator n=1 Tax=Bradyrhizobium TaxID=374 RepID=UPI0004B7B848|nr:helix-turn-helix domain-containing protein [Bradyrhizobium elkanii]WLA82621.1 helix-turn-helix domain-containing protein [Bradyrhizobium elkanii]
MPQPKQRRAPAGATKRKAAAATVDYRALAQFRYELRRFLAFSEEGARKAGMTPRQHQALLGIKGFVDPGPPTVGDIARFLLIRHHSAVELMNRMAKLGLVSRLADPDDARRVQLRLTAKGEQKLQAVSKKNIEELRRVASPALRRLLKSSPSSGED